MKKLLVATSALVAAAGSAAALDVTLGGTITIGIEDTNAADSFAFTPSIDASLNLAASGESMGWVYGGTLSIGRVNALIVGNETDISDPEDGEPYNDQFPWHVDGDGDIFNVAPNANVLAITNARVFMGADFMGTVAFSNSCGDFVDTGEDWPDFFDSNPEGDATVDGVIGDNCLSWTGFQQFGLGISAAMGLGAEVDEVTNGAGETGTDDDVFSVGLTADLGNFDAAVEYGLNSGNIDASLTGQTGGITVGLLAGYDSHDEIGAGDALYWGASVGMPLAGGAISVSYEENNDPTSKPIGLGYTMGCYGVSTVVDVAGEGVTEWSAGATDCEYHEGFNYSLSVGSGDTMDDVSTSAGVTVTF